LAKQEKVKITKLILLDELKKEQLSVMFTIGRVKRLKQAKDEAVVEIENFKNEKERQHKILEQEVFILKLSKTLNNLIKNKQLN
jgi:hypothetical protein